MVTCWSSSGQAETFCLLELEELEELEADLFPFGRLASAVGMA